MNYTKKTTREIFGINQSRPEVQGMQALKVWLHDIRSLHNTGSAFRSCDAFGAGEIILSGFTPTPPRPEITKTALGAEEFVKWREVEDPIDCIRDLKNNGYSIIGIEQTHNSNLITDFKPANSDKLCVIFGNEVTGIDQELLPHLDFCLEIPQFGQKHSLNISVTVGIVLYHMLLNFQK